MNFPPFNSAPFFFTLSLTLISTFQIQAQPFNDDCSDAAAIIIPNDNYGLGLFTSDIVSVSGATVETGTYFLESSGHDRDLWFTFTIPTARYGKLELFQVNPLSPASSMGFITYLTANTTCPPPQSWIEPAKLAPVPQQGSTETECLDAGTYLVQVTLSPDAIGQIYLELTLGLPFENVPGLTPLHDHPENATSIVIAGFATFDVGCHTVESDAEFDCFPGADPEELNQSLWWRFQGGVFPEYIGVEFTLSANSGSAVLPERLGVRLFEGNSQNNDWTTLPQIGDCQFFKLIEDGTNSRMYAEFFCEDITPNTTISMALFFPGGYNNTELRTRVCRRGGFDSGAPRPILSQMASNHVLGVLPSSPSGILTAVIDTFTCGSSLTLPQNQCGTVNPPDFVTMTDANGDSYNLEYSSWIQFELAEDAKVIIAFETDEKYRFARVFNKGITDNCSNINATNDLVATFQETIELSCLPQGQYAIQVLGGNPTADVWECADGQLGKRYRLLIKVFDEQGLHQFALNNANAYEDINNGNPLTPGTIYELEKDTFGCPNTVLIAGGTCTDRKKIMVREFEVAQEGTLRIFGLDTGPNKDFHHKLYKGSIATLALNQNAFTDNQVIVNALEHVTGCINTTAFGGANYYCLSPGTYTWVTFGDLDQQGISFGPSMAFYNWTTLFDDPNNPDQLGDLTNETEFTTPQDQFSCGQNPLTIAGVPPCGDGVNIQQIYRVFFLSEDRKVKFNSLDAIPFNLFKGNIADGVNTLVPWTGENGANEPWNLCAAAQRTSDCDLLTPGFYTLVAYGWVADTDDPALESSAGEPGNMGQTHFFLIELEEPVINCNLPSKTCFFNGGELADWDHTVLSELCPQQTLVTFMMDTMFINCAPDTPFSSHPIEPCDSDDSRTAYFGFKLSDVSFVSLKNIPGDMDVKIYDFDATLTPQLLISEDPVAPCSESTLGLRSYCNVPPGTYTIVVFASAEYRGTRLVPILEVEQVQPSRFDHWAQAYDFGLVPDNGDFNFGKEGDINPLNELLVPSSDYMSCLSSGSPTDPIDGICCTEYNPLINDQPFNIQYTETQPPNQYFALRNLIYSFLLEGSGQCTVKVANCINDANFHRPAFAIYKSNSGATPFELLQTNGGIDSTYASGLTLEMHSSSLSFSCDTLCTIPRSNEITFTKTACEEFTSRYYIVVTQPPFADMNQQISVGIQYESAAFVGVQFDEFEEAGSAVNNAPSPSYQLVEGYQFGQAMSFQCATASPDDPLISNCEPEHTVWYRFTADEVGALHLGYSDNLTNIVFTTPYMKLFKAGASGTFNDLIEIPLTDFPLNNPQNNTGSNWRKGCIDAGTYYLFWAACGDTLDIFDVYRPRILFESHPGDYCSTAVPIDLIGEGQAWASLTVNCHTIGTELLDGPESYDCLLGPEGYKSSFFILNLIGPAKRDVTFSMLEFTTATFEQIRYRVLPGYCGAATPGLCSSDPNTAFTLNCLGEGTYIIQVVSIASAEGDIAFTVTAVNSPNQDCVPLDPYQPNAFFTYDACEGDTIYFENQSTFGEDMVYEWIFPDYTTSERNPEYYYPRPSELTYITVSLRATNTATGASDFVTLQVEISPIVEPIEEDIFLLCEGDSVLVTAQNYHSFAEYDWSDGQYGSTISIVEAGQYFVSVSNVRCPQYDSVAVVEVYCDSLYLEACDSVGYTNYLIYESGIFMDTIDGGITKDTLRKVTVVINSIDQLILDPAFLEIEIGDQVELQAYTTAQDPIFTWQPFDLLEFIREDKVRLMPPRSTIVTLLVEDANGCLKEAETVIDVAEIYNDVFIPNAFSPNQDGVNDYFFPFGADHIVEVADFRIFDRWGAEVFQNEHFQLNDWREGWDAYVKGKEVAAGVYVYFAKITYINGAVILFKGDVTVLR